MFHRGLQRNWIKKKPPKTKSKFISCLLKSSAIIVNWERKAFLILVWQLYSFWPLSIPESRWSMRKYVMNRITYELHSDRLNGRNQCESNLLLCREVLQSLLLSENQLMLEFKITLKSISTSVLCFGQATQLLVEPSLTEEISNASVNSWFKISFFDQLLI